MYRLIPTLGSYSYGTNSNSYYSTYDNSQQSGFGQSNNLLLNFYQSGIQVLILLLIQQQLRDLLNTTDKDEQQPDDQDQSAANTIPFQHCHCPCPAPVITTPETSQSPAEENVETEQEDDEYALIMENIRQLQQLVSHQNMANSLTNYNHYIARHQNDQNIIKSVQMSGGRIIETTDRFFVAEDNNQTRYIIQRS